MFIEYCVFLMPIYHKRAQYVMDMEKYIELLAWHRDGKTYQHGNNVGVIFVLARVKSVPNFTLFCCENELCRNFAIFVVIFCCCHFIAFNGTLWHLLELLWFLLICVALFCTIGSFGPFTLFC